ncbi:YheC/YheD family endospore coat-associated protein [Bacillus litorisediminis]|uniref:YheC/YheD family endospore coat-associated protein n=1 Tax=Bacillus litorisediminis TaxID=2922713 RepID=UPI001FABA3C0|nr:YheC/YheD family protein [Bacillus litorisediminis]
MKLCTLKIVDQEGFSLGYPKNWSQSKPVKVSFGGATEEVQSAPLTTADHTFLLSKPLAEKLYMPLTIRRIHVIQKDNTLYFGPLIGIITSGFTSIKTKPIGDRSSFFSRIMRFQAKQGVVFIVFGKDHINWDEGTIKGFSYNEQGWEQVTVPFPNVIYDRLPNRKMEGEEKFRIVKKKLQDEYLIPWFNPGFFNKLDVFERIEQDNDAQRYLPETHAFTSFDVIERMLSKYGHVYVKPQNGSLGSGIHQLFYDRDSDSYYCRFKDKEGNKRLRKYQTLESLFNNLFKNKSLKNMMIQQGIALMKYNHHPVDFRVHTNKDEAGNWTVSAIAAKVAGTGSPTTHIKYGGEVKTLEEIFPDTKQRKKIEDQITEASLILSRALEKNMEGIIAEIGFDLGVDQQEQIWLFEANSKPGRSIFIHPDLKGFEHLTRKLMLSYAIYLTKMSILSPEELFS